MALANSSADEADPTAESELFDMFFFSSALEMLVETLAAEGILTRVEVETLGKLVVVHSFPAEMTLCLLLWYVASFAAGSTTKNT